MLQRIVRRQLGVLLLAGCDLPAAHGPCGCDCSYAALAVGGYRLSAGLRGMMPGETEGWGLGS